MINDITDPNESFGQKPDDTSKNDFTLRLCNFVISNPDDHEQYCGENRGAFFRKIYEDERKNIRYLVVVEAIAPSGTHHLHGFINFRTPRNYSTIEKLLPYAHLEKSKGASKINYQYITKTGSYSDTKETVLKNTLIEFGTCPGRGVDARIGEIAIDCIKQDIPIAKIVSNYPYYWNKTEDLEKLDGLCIRDGIKDLHNFDRKLSTVLVTGNSDLNLGDIISKATNRKETYYVGSYNSGMFDGYSKQKILIFDDFSVNSLSSNQLLSIINPKETELPARYHNRPARFEQVFIILMDNIDVFMNSLKQQTGAYEKFLQRLSHIEIYENENFCWCYHPSSPDKKYFGKIEKGGIVYYDENGQEILI